MPDNYTAPEGTTLDTTTDTEKITIKYSDSTAPKFTLPALTKDDCTFMGWTKDDDTTLITASPEFPLDSGNADATYTAVFGSYYQDGKNRVKPLPDGYVLLTSGTTDFTQSCYVVYGEVTLNNSLSFTGDNVTLILLDGSTLTLEGNAISAEGKTLTVYAQNGYEGGTPGCLTANSITAGTLNLFGGNITAGTLSGTVSVKNVTIGTTAHDSKVYDDNGRTASEFTVTLDLDGGTFDTEDGSAPTNTITATIAYPGTGYAQIIAADMPKVVKEHCAFKSWQNNGTDCTFPLTVTNNETTLTATWEALSPHTLTLDCKGGKLSDTAGYVLKDSAAGLYVREIYTDDTDTITLPIPTYTDKTFSGWKTGDGEASASVEITPGDFNADTTYTAVWTPADDSLTDPFTYHSLILSGKIGVNFYAAIPEGYIADGAYVKFSVNGAEDTQVNINTGSYHQPEENGTKYYLFECPINSIQMADTIKAVLYCKKSESDTATAAGQGTYTAKAYLDQAVAANGQVSGLTGDKAAALLNLVNAMKDYGHYVQIPLQAYHSDSWKFTGDTANTTAVTTHVQMDASANDLTVPEITGYDAVDTNTKTDISNVQYSLVLDSETKLELYLQPVTAGTTAYIKLDGGDPVSAALSDNTKATLAAATAGIPSHLLDKTHTFTVSTNTDAAARFINNSDTTMFTVTLSPYSYIQSVLGDNESHSDQPSYGNAGSTAEATDMQKAAAAIYHYCEKSKAYRTSINGN